MDFYILPIIILLLVTAYLIYRGYAARARSKNTGSGELAILIAVSAFNPAKR